MESTVITICNKLNRVDSVTGLDVWFKTVLHNISYSIEKITNVSGTTVSMGQTFNILIPFTGKYVPYEDWKSLSNKESYFTMKQGDIIFIDLEILDNITPNNIQTIKTQHEPKVCVVRSIVEVPKRPGISIQLKVSGI